MVSYRPGRRDHPPTVWPHGGLMGVRKFPSVEDMPGPPPLPRLDPDNLRLAFGLASAMTAFRPVHRTPGIRKFRSWNELLAAQENP
jgi:hypothetical protein